MPRQTGEDHGDVVAGVPISAASYNNPVAMELAAIGGGLQSDRHFLPLCKGGQASKLNSPFVNDDGIRG